MKSRITIAFIFLALTFCFRSEATTPEQEAVDSTRRIEVVDFHSTHRCETCLAIEANTKYTLETYFNEEMKNGVITLQIINVDLKENRKIAEKFQAIGSSLYLNIVKEGNEEQLDLTSFAFLKGRNQDAFSKGLRDRIKEHLNHL